LKTTLNQLLNNFIQIKSIQKVNDDFHARFSAKKRVYRYIISTKPPTVFNQNYIHYKNNLDIELLKKVSKNLVGIYDFEYFSKKGSKPNSTIREIYDIKIYRYKSLIIFKFIANSYLRSQIRMMVDFLLKISDNKLTTQDLKAQLNKTKLISYTLVPPNGLYLSNVLYRDHCTKPMGKGN
jgi:tRNA pseudouridine38-40 synthase